VTSRLLAADYRRSGSLTETEIEYHSKRFIVRSGTTPRRQALG
jgi:hypothetical protein